MAERTRPPTSSSLGSAPDFVSRLRAALSSSQRPLQAVTFWLAIALPWVVLALTLYGVATERPQLFAALVGLTFVCAVAGHGYRR